MEKSTKVFIIVIVMGPARLSGYVLCGNSVSSGEYRGIEEAKFIGEKNRTESTGSTTSCIVLEARIVWTYCTGDMIHILAVVLLV